MCLNIYLQETFIIQAHIYKFIKDYKQKYYYDRVIFINMAKNPIV